MKNLYTLETIKKAFWETFHQAGEVYFGSIDKYTEEQWHEFVKHLEEEEGKVENE